MAEHTHHVPLVVLLFLLALMGFYLALVLRCWITQAQGAKRWEAEWIARNRRTERSRRG